MNREDSKIIAKLMRTGIFRKLVLVEQLKIRKLIIDGVIQTVKQYKEALVNL